MDKLFENEAHTTAIYSDGSEYLLLKLSGRIDFEDYRRVMLLLVEKLQEVNTRQIILDSYDLEYDNPKSRVWFLTSFIYKIQRTVGENLWVAIIRPRNVFQKLAIGTLVNLVKSQGFLFEIKFCPSKCDAVDWFEQFALPKG